MGITPTEEIYTMVLSLLTLVRNGM